MKNNTTFVRVEKNRNYTTIHNEFLKRKDLSWKAKGIMTYLLSLPDDWVVNLDEIKRNATDGESSFRSGWKELVSAGYVSRQPVRDEKTKKIDYWETVIKESISCVKSHNVENHNVGIHQVGNHKVDNRELLSTKELSTNIQSTNNTPSSASTRFPYKEIITYLNEKTGRNYKHIAKINQRVIKARMNEGYTLEDFKTVIDKKTTEWNDDVKMKEYLRPETLFGTKFDRYLNEDLETKSEPWSAGNNEYDPLWDVKDL